jgi:glycosyltransferase involved in cell wall biosynthesis
MRIGLIYLGRHGPGGPISLELAHHLSKKANLFAVVSENADHIAAWRESGIPIIEVPTFDTTLQALMSCLDEQRLRALADRIAKECPDVILYPMVHPWTLYLQRYLEKTPDVVTVHDPAAHPGLLHMASNLWETIAAQRSTRCVVLGHRFIEEMRARGVSPGKIDVIPHAVFSYYDRFPDAKGATPLPNSLLFFGRITAYKGLDVLIRAFLKLQSRWPDLRLNIVGEGDMRPFRKLLDGAKNVTVVNNWVDDAAVGTIFRENEIVVVPYVSASQSGVIALAAQFGCPVIATKVGAIPEQIRNGDTGLLVEPDSVDALAAGIDRLLRDGDLRKQCGRQLAFEARAMTNWEATSDAYLESCRRAAASGCAQS